MEDIVEEGYWWYPDDPNKKYPGTIKYSSQGGIRLSISSIIEPQAFSARKSAEMLHGTTKSGDKYTLLKGFETSSGVSSSDLGVLGTSPHAVGHKDIFFNFVLKGAHSRNIYEKIKIKSIHFVPEFINRWFFDSSLIFEKTDNFEELNISYNPDNKYEYKLKEGSKLLLHRRLNSHPFSADWDGNLELKERTYVSLLFNELKSLDEAYEYYSAFEDFFTVLFSKRSTCMAISLELDQTYSIERYGKPEEISCHVDWLARPIRAKEGEPPHPGDILFRFEDIRDSFGDIIDNWICKSGKLKQIRQLYISSLYSKEQYLESSILNLSKAVEVYHRRFYEGTLIDKNKFESEVLSVVVEAIPKELDRVVKDTFRSRMAFMNEFSLNKRLKHLNDEHKKTLSLFDINSKKVIRDIVQARNHFTHYTLENPNEVISFDSLCICMDYLKLLCDICFISEMGFSEEDICKSISGSQTYKHTSLRLKS